MPPFLILLSALVLWGFFDEKEKPSKEKQAEPDLNKDVDTNASTVPDSSPPDSTEQTLPPDSELPPS